MDRLESMAVFAAVVDRGGFAPAARRLRKSRAFVSRSIAFLERRAGLQLLQRTTRSTRLTESGARYLASCRRILAAVAEADSQAEDSEPRGLLTLTAPILFGRLQVRPAITRYLRKYPQAKVRLLLLDRVANMMDEGIDVAVRIGRLADSSLLARKVGAVERVVCASPAYLKGRRPPKTPRELRNHDCIGDNWSFVPRFQVNGAEPAIAAALDGLGVISVLSYQVEKELRDGRLVRLLHKWQHEPLPVQLVHPRLSPLPPKVRAFLELAIPLLEAALQSPHVPQHSRPL